MNPPGKRRLWESGLKGGLSGGITSFIWIYLIKHCIDSSMNGWLWFGLIMCLYLGIFWAVWFLVGLLLGKIVPATRQNLPR